MVINSAIAIALITFNLALVHRTGEIDGTLLDTWTQKLIEKCFPTRDSPRLKYIPCKQFHTRGLRQSALPHRLCLCSLDNEILSKTMATQRCKHEKTRVFGGFFRLLRAPLLVCF